MRIVLDTNVLVSALLNLVLNRHGALPIDTRFANPDDTPFYEVAMESSF